MKVVGPVLSKFGYDSDMNGVIQFLQIAQQRKDGNGYL